MTLHLLTFSTLYPNDRQPNHGIFVENRLRHLVASGEVTSTVVAPVPWFPSRSSLFGDWALFAGVAQTETRHGLTVHHPRYPVIPKFGMSIAPYLLYWRTLSAIQHMLDVGLRFDAIDAHYVYPDGVAAAFIGKRLGLPVVITARGTDVNLIPRHPGPRRLIQQAIKDSAALVGVSAAIRAALLELGAPPEKVTVLRNGVDVAVFTPMDRRVARANINLTRPTLISVGHLIERKGHHRIIEAMTQLPEFDLLVVGEGPERERLTAQINRSNLYHRVRLLGSRPHAELASLYSAADALVLASSREGWPNVLLEAMACGTPVVASNIWGNPEVVQDPTAGVLMTENTSDGVVEAVRRLFADLPDRDLTRAYAERFSWDETTAGQISLFRSLCAHDLSSHRTGHGVG